jgi:hypothetical protein
MSIVHKLKQVIEEAVGVLDHSMLLPLAQDYVEAYIQKKTGVSTETQNKVLAVAQGAFAQIAAAIEEIDKEHAAAQAAAKSESPPPPTKP